MKKFTRITESNSSSKLRQSIFTETGRLAVAESMLHGLSITYLDENRIVKRTADGKIVEIKELSPRKIVKNKKIKLY